MSIFFKHEVKENDGRLEALLYLDKRSVSRLLNADLNFLVKNEAITYINTKFEAIPIEVVRIMAGSIPYFSFAMVNKK